MRSISLEGFLEPLSDLELNADWQKLDAEFRRNYLVFGHNSGTKIDSIQELRSQQDRLLDSAIDNRPQSFIGYKYQLIQRICFYTVTNKDFANCELDELDADNHSWNYSLRVS
jgi:hypothetical protein